MNPIIAIEGGDGAGKRTLSEAIRCRLDGDTALVSFPRYHHGRFGPIIRQALDGQLGDAVESVWSLAVLFAADRSDWARLEPATSRSGAVIADRYVASNAAYGAARLRLRGETSDAFLHWIEHLELEQMQVPRPDLTILVRTPYDLAATRAVGRGHRDVMEKLPELQRTTLTVYEELATADWLSPWVVVDSLDDEGKERPPESLADEVVAPIREVISRAAK